MNPKASPRWIFVSFILLFFLVGCTTGQPGSTGIQNAKGQATPVGPQGSTAGGLLPRQLMVVGNSMEPTIKNQQKVTYRSVKYADLKRGDILVFKKDGSTVIRRLIGLPGESIEIREGVVYINDQALKETYISIPATEALEKDALAIDEYFVMSGNPDNRNDSRLFGPVKAADLLGRVDLKP